MLLSQSVELCTPSLQRGTLDARRWPLSAHNLVRLPNSQLARYGGRSFVAILWL